MEDIHVCYRRNDAEESAQRLVRFLKNRLGDRQVTAAADALAGPLRDGDWLLVVIGPRWIAPADADDLLSRQLAAALAQALNVVPLLVDGAAMPAATELPEPLHGLLRRQSLELTHENWESDLRKLLEVILGPVAGGGSLPVKAAPKIRKGILTRAKEVIRFFRHPILAGPPLDEFPKMEGGDEQAPGAASPEPEPVLLGAAAPGAVKPGSEFTAHFVAYVAEQEDEVRRILAKRSPRSESHLGEALCRWRHGTHIRVRLRARALRIDPEEQDFVWVGGRNLLAFDV